jgi:hypothetical protein
MKKSNHRLTSFFYRSMVIFEGASEARRRSDNEIAIRVNGESFTVVLTLPEDQTGRVLMQA